MADGEEDMCWRTLVEALAQLVVGGHEVECGLGGWVVGRDGVNKRRQGLFDPAEVLVENVVHGERARRCDKLAWLR